MRAIAVPDYEVKHVYELCINSITDTDLRERLTSIVGDIVIAGDEYKKKASCNELHTIPPNDGRNNDLVLGSVTKEELKQVYSWHMVGSKKPGRDIYDRLKSSAHLGKCPFCGVGHVSALDHYLPKAKYPLLSVLPVNLVPACDQCNKRKSQSFAVTAETQTLHPYYDHGHFIDEQWLFAEVDPVSHTPCYFVKPPMSWSTESAKRVESHFVDFNLAEKYGIEAANEISGQQFHFDKIQNECGLDELIIDLNSRALSYASCHVNSWQTALYQALVVFNKKLLLTEKCPVCDGEYIACTCCHGNGWMSLATLQGMNISDHEKVGCPECDGRPMCSICGGSGEVAISKAIQLTHEKE